MRTLTEKEIAAVGSDAYVTVTAARVPEQRRLVTLPLHFNHLCLAFETRVYNIARELCPDYNGGYWHFNELSNGGFYMAPATGDDNTLIHLTVEGNGFSGSMSADAAGVVICLFALSRMAFHYETESLADHYHWLRDFAADHKEVRLIFKAID